MAHFSFAGSDRIPGKLSQGAIVPDSKGTHATVVSFEEAQAGPLVVLRTAHGNEIVIPVAVLEQKEDGTIQAPIEYGAYSDGTFASPSATHTIPVMQEELQIDKHIVDTEEGIRLRKSVHQHEETVDVPLMRDELSIEHIAFDKIIEDKEPPGLRYEGATLVVPVFEEVLVVEKRLRLKEEIRITLHRHETHAPQKVTLRSEAISIEALDKKQADHRSS